MSLVRSDRMGFYNVLMPREYAWEVLNELGELNTLQFIDNNSHETAFNRPYSNYVKRCEDLEAKIHQIELEMKRFDMPITQCEDPKLFLRDLRGFLMTRNKAERTYFDDLEGQIEEKVTNLNEQIRNYDNLIDNYNHLVEFRQVLLLTRPYIGDSDFRAQYAGEEQNPVDYVGKGGVRFSYLAGVIDTEAGDRFRKILFRVTRGMAWTTLLNIVKPKNPEKEMNTYFKEGANQELKPKTVFLIVYQGGSFDMMKVKLNRICESFGSSKYGIPEEPKAFNQKLQEIDQQLRDAQNVLAITQDQIKHILQQYSEPRNFGGPYSLIEDLKLFILKEKAVYHNLNMLKTKNALYQGGCWCPADIADQVRHTIQELKRRKSEIGGCEFKEAPFPPHLKPPTHFRLNDVSWVFQQIVNTYGIPRYREINPGLFAIATFPFLFGVMFGDIGHGAIIMVVGLLLCLFKEQIEKEKSSFAVMLPARYLLLFQGFFATYCGFIYNDFMAMPWNLFGSCYAKPEGYTGPDVKKTDIDCTYPFGIDPAWYGTSNELTFLNSFKMKTSIVLGVSQMLFGIALRGVNNFHFNQWLEFFFEFIPMMLFLSLTFGYMAVLIFLKWSMPWGTPGFPDSQAPSIIAIFIKMALSPGVWDPNVGMPLYGDPEGKEQAELQMSFLLIAVVCAVLILVPKPIILLIKNSGGNAPAQHGYNNLHDDPSIKEPLMNDNDDNIMNQNPGPKPQVEEHIGHGGHGGEHGDHFEFGEVFVHQVIETIEFVLGSISNTASYLRLWALSLAHSQLAKVFFDNTMGGAIESGNFILAFVGFLFFANVTLGVLLLMDQMECFLHALRLHWVEFQNKFYKADGYLFQPFSFEQIIKERGETA